MHDPESQPLRLSVIIPVWNDSAGLARLLPQLLLVPGVAQVILSDDASDPPCSAGTLGIPETEDPRLTWLRSDGHRGAGHARNIGLDHVTSPYVLFFDSDDMVLHELSLLLADLARPDCPDFDFCLFRHVDSRRRAAGDPGPLLSDQRHWDAISVPNAPTLLRPAQAARICRISAYPWNKIYRTAFLRDRAIRCTEIMIHNDLELHWTSFLRAGRILASSRPCCEHFVHEDGVRLTNRSGAERFQVFRALEAVQSDIATDAGRAAIFADAAAEFYVNLFRWIDGTLEPELREPFRLKARSFLRRNLSHAVFTLVATADPGLARRINRFLSEPAA